MSTLPNTKAFGPVCAGLLALALGQVACSDATSPPDWTEDQDEVVGPAARALAVEPRRVVLERIGSTTLLGASAFDDAGIGQDVLAAWLSRDPSVVSVDRNGWISANAFGTSTLVGTYQSLRDSVLVTVGPAETASLRFVVSADSIPLMGGHLLLTAEVIDTAGIRTTDPVVAFSTPTPDVLSIAPNGAMVSVTGVAPGTGRVIVQRGSFADTVTIGVGRVSAQSASASGGPFQMNPAEIVFDRPNSMWFASATHTDATGSRVVVPKFSTTNSGVVRVDAKGWIRATGNGNALIVGRYNGLVDTIRVQVGGAQVASLRLQSDTATLSAVGDQVRLFADVFDAAGRLIANPAVTWSSLHPQVASVSGNGGVGTVKALANGTARIVAQRGTRTDTATVTIGGGGGPSTAPASIAISPAQDSISSPGGTTQLSAVIRDAQGQPITQSVATWKSLDTTIVTVGPAGPSATRTVTAVKQGSVRITASTNGLADTAWVHVGSSQQSVSWTLTHTPATPSANSPVAISASASSPAGIATLAISVDGSVVKTCAAATCSHSQSYAAGSHTYGASATDNNGVVSTAAAQSFSVSSGPTPPGVVPADLMPTIGPLLPRGNAQTLQALDVMFLARELSTYLHFSKQVPNTTGSTANHYGGLRSRLQWAIRNGQPFGAGASTPAQHVYGRGRHIVLHYLQNYAKPNNYSLAPHNNTGMADVEILWWLERTPEAWNHIWTVAHASMSTPTNRFGMQIGDPRQIAVPLQSYSAAHRMGIPFKKSPFSASTWNDHKATSWRDVGNKQIAAVMAGGNVHANGAVHSPDHASQCRSVSPCEAYFMNAMLATEFLRWHGFVAPNTQAFGAARKMVDHLISEQARKGAACLPYLSSDSGCAPDLAAFFVWPALVLWQETGDAKYRTFALQNLTASQKAWVVGTKQFNQTFSTGAQTADALLAGQPWR